METKQSWNLELWDEAKQETNHDAGFRFRVAVVVLVSTPALEQLSPKHQIPHIESVLIQQIKCIIACKSITWNSMSALSLKGMESNSSQFSTTETVLIIQHTHASTLHQTLTSLYIMIFSFQLFICLSPVYSTNMSHTRIICSQRSTLNKRLPVRSSLVALVTLIVVVLRVDLFRHKVTQSTIVVVLRVDLF